MAGNPPASDEILNINQGLIPPEAPASSFLLEGDIVKVSPFRVFSSASPKWPKRRGTVQIPYIISYKYDKPSVKIIKEAFADFARFTCIKFVPYSYQRDFISIMPMSGCFSSVGRTGGMQVVSLAPACLRRGKGVTLHELMHVVGFWHEHSRADRDKYIRISWNEILTESPTESTTQENIMDFLSNELEPCPTEGAIKQLNLNSWNILQGKYQAWKFQWLKPADQVLVEGVIGPDAGSDVGVDDLSVCVAECRGGCDPLTA
ncbi:F-box only protein 48 [Platysternon megacephalum]|uniref:Metalloendopeptidase n=1 Tax=Platysternon megacephalum TaxID=55544 RepID=A0A4D9DR49_9SAUR|nr:F-box only protein 48 [Platysternon megacephalum]